RTTLLGTLVVGAVLSNVVALNFLFDVPGKSLSPHMSLIAGLLLFPDAKRLVDVHMRGRPVAPADLAPDVPGRGVFRTHRTALKGAVVALFIVSPFVTIERTRGYVCSAPPPHPLAVLYEARSFAIGRREVRPVA